MSKYPIEDRLRAAYGALGLDYAKLVTLLNDLAAERDDFTFVLR